MAGSAVLSCARTGLRSFGPDNPVRTNLLEERESPSTVDFNALTVTIISIIGLLVLLVGVFTDAAIKILNELEKLREAWRRFRQEQEQEQEQTGEETGEESQR
ncbi:hypothetical protein ACK389_05535 [Streptomyces antibioticus]|uniref:hypothetical protein n=1 Tax=Streptomyces antibioticus TaxID=1890 RepID=UPI000A69483F